MRNLIWSMEKWKSAAKTAYSGNIVGYVWNISHSAWLQGNPNLSKPSLLQSHHLQQYHSGDFLVNQF